MRIWRSGQKLPSLFRRGAEALRGGVVVKKNQILLDYHPVRPKRRPPLLNKEGSFARKTTTVMPNEFRSIKCARSAKSAFKKKRRTTSTHCLEDPQSKIQNPKSKIERCHRPGRSGTGHLIDGQDN